MQSQTYVQYGDIFEAYKLTRLIRNMKDTEKRRLEKIYMVYVSEILKNLVQCWNERESVSYNPWGGVCITQP